MSAVSLLLVKDGRLLARSRLLTAGLLLYPLLIALVVGVAVRYAGERPRVAFVEEAGLPSVVHVGNRNFDIRARLERATEVRLVSMSRAQAERELASGRTLATLVIPRDFADRLSSLSTSPKIVLSGALSRHPPRCKGKDRPRCWEGKDIMSRTAVESDIRKTLGLVPEFLTEIPDSMIETEWELQGVRARRDRHPEQVQGADRARRLGRDSLPLLRLLPHGGGQAGGQCHIVTSLLFPN